MHSNLLFCQMGMKSLISDLRNTTGQLVNHHQLVHSAMSEIAEGPDNIRGHLLAVF